VSTDNHPDLRIVEVDTEHVQISRKEIGQIQADAALRPLMGGRKVYVLVEVERLSAVAGNQLLKLLEEPPPAVTFVLTSADIGAVLPTILSRCQVVRMQPVQRETIENHLTTQLEVDPEVAEIIAGVADGRVGWAIRAGADVSLLEARSQSIEELVTLIESARLARLLKSQEIAGRWTSDRGRVIDELDWWARALRDAAVLAAAPSHDAARGAADIARVTGRLSARESIDAARAVQEVARLLEQNVNPRLALDTLVLDLPSVDARN